MTETKVRAEHAIDAVRTAFVSAPNHQKLNTLTSFDEAADQVHVILAQVLTMPVDGLTIVEAMNLGKAVINAYSSITKLQTFIARAMEMEKDNA